MTRWSRRLSLPTATSATGSCRTRPSTSSTTPPDLRDFDERIADVRREKESAIDSQDFEKAASLRDTEKQLIDKKDLREKEWKAGDMDTPAEVNEELIAESSPLPPASRCSSSPRRSRSGSCGWKTSCTVA